MPRFDFRCTACSHVFEAISPANLTSLPCVACQCRFSVRLVSAPCSPRMGGTRHYSESEMKKIKEPVFQNSDGSIDV